MPDSATPCGLPLALDGMLKVALRALSAAGVNVTSTAQLAPGASVEPLHLLGANSDAFVPAVPIVPGPRLAVPCC